MFFNFYFFRIAGIILKDTYNDYDYESHITLKFFIANISETITDEVLQRLYGPDTVVAEIKYQGIPPQQIRLSDIPVTEKLEKFVEDVK